MPENKKVTYYQKGTYNQQTRTGVEVYPKTSVEQVVGIEDYEKREVKNGFDFAGDHSQLEGIYKVVNGVNNPFGEDGTLTVVKSGSKLVETWSSKTYSAHRLVESINPVAAGISTLTINGDAIDTSITTSSFTNGVQVTSDNVKGHTIRTVNLLIGGTYVLSGSLINCRIVVNYPAVQQPLTGKKKKAWIDGLTDEARKTKIVFDNLYVFANDEIKNDDEDTLNSMVIACEPLVYSELAGGSTTPLIEIELAAGSKNYLVREMTQDMVSSNSKGGVIFFDGPDLKLYGTGSLGISSWLGGHAIKVKKNFTIEGMPIIKAKAYHDIFHGNDSLVIKGGYFHIIDCNDVLGCDTARGDAAVGKVRLEGGLFDIERCGGTFLQADNAIVYPNVRIHIIDEVGEGLYLESKPGTVKNISAKGEYSGFGVIDRSTQSFKYRGFKTKPDPLAINIDLWDPALDDIEYVTPNKEGEVGYGKFTIDGVEYNSKGSHNDQFLGIIVYAGATYTKEDGATYTESARNTHIGDLGFDTVLSFNKTYSTVPVSTVYPDEVDPAEIEAVDYSLTQAITDSFSAIDFTYSTTIVGGLWKVGINQDQFDEYKKSMEIIINNISTMIVPPKTVIIAKTQSAEYDSLTGEYSVAENSEETELVNNGEEVAVGAEITVGTAVPKTYAALAKIATGDYLYSSKTGYPASITLEVGQCIKVTALLDPVNTTNNQIKWTTAGNSEETVFGRVKSDDTSYCWIRGLQPGEEDIIVSAKAPSKDYLPIKAILHVKVVPASEPAGE